MLDYEPSGNYSASHVRMYATAIEAFAKAAHAKGLRLGVCIGNWGIVDAHEVPQGMKIYESAGADILMSMGATYHAYGDLSKDRDFVSEVYSQGVAQSTYSVGVGTTLTSGCPRPAKTDFNWTEASLGAWFNWLSDDTRAPAAWTPARRAAMCALYVLLLTSVFLCAALATGVNPSWLRA